jgi:protease secretion system membrane fusion protein
MKALDNKNAPTEVIAHDVEPLTVNTDAGSYARVGWLIVLVGVVGFFLWALFAPLDKGVPLSGTVATESNRKAVQHLTGGIVQQILVKEGDVVKAGQVLVKMNPVTATAQSELNRSSLYSALATEARLNAERTGAAAITFPKELLERRSEPAIAEMIALQNQLFSSRRMALQNELAAIDENISGLKLQIKSTEESRENKKVQLDILKEQLAGMRDLAKDGYVARNRLLDLERTYAQTAGAISEDVGQIGRARSQVMELTLRKSQRMQDYQKEVRTSLSEVLREADSMGARAKASDHELASVDVKAPVDGTVVGLAVFTHGGVVSPGFKMMDIVPAGDALVVHGQLPVHLIDRVHRGLPVDLMFSAFNSATTPHIPGEVIKVAADRSVDERSGMPYYAVQVRVSAAGLKKISAHKLDIQPGMPVELFVKTGERTMMNYLLKPLLDRARSSMSEE